MSVSAGSRVVDTIVAMASGSAALTPRMTATPRPAGTCDDSEFSPAFVSPLMTISSVALQPLRVCSSGWSVYSAHAWVFDWPGGASLPRCCWSWRCPGPSCSAFPISGVAASHLPDAACGVATGVGGRASPVRPGCIRPARRPAHAQTVAHAAGEDFEAGLVERARGRRDLPDDLAAFPA